MGIPSIVRSARIRVPLFALAALMATSGVFAGELHRAGPIHYAQRASASDAKRDPPLMLASSRRKEREVRAEKQGAPTGPGVAPAPSPRHAKDSGAHPKQVTLDEVVVTGTHILGVRTTASPMWTYSREEIKATGASDIYQFMQTVPAALGDTNPVALSANQYGRANLLDNASQGVGFDLRGLGPQSTLVLLNGERLAPGNITGNFVDVSLIPLNIISRVDVVRDSASATYGSDAVGGVVNINTLKRFQGLESEVTYGSVTSGQRHDTQFDSMWGTTWQRGGVVLAYEFDDQTPLDARSRSFTANLPSPYTLFPEQVRHGVYGSFDESLADGIRLSGFALYGHRRNRAEMVQAGIYYRGDTKVDSYMADLNARKAIASAGALTASVDYSGNDTDFNQLARLGSGQPLVQWDSPHGRSALISLHVGYSGWVGQIHGRRVGLAVGVQGQADRFAYENFWAPSPSYQKSRRVVAEYVETNVPVSRDISFDASLRHERYSDFGSTTNPKFGVQWRPSPSLALAGTYSTSFVAPTLSELVPDAAEAGYLPVSKPQSAVPCNFFDPSEAGCAVVLTTGGGNPNLGAEKANTWTGSIRVHPTFARGLRAEISYYDIHQRGVINTVFSYLPSIFECLDFAGQLGSPVVTTINAAQAEARFPNATNPFNVNEAAVSALCDGRYLNLSKVATSGVDFQLKYTRMVKGVRFDSTASGTRMLRYRTQFTAAAPPVSFLNTVNNPVSLRVRLGEAVSLAKVSASVFVNYVGPYTNEIVVPNERVSSWTTSDLRGTYRTGLGSEDSKEVWVTLGVDNLANRNPPFVSNESPEFQMDFDGANANPLGRYLYVKVGARL